MDGVPPQLTAINRFPVKSCRGESLDAAVVEPWGLAGDRRWMVVDATGECVTAREEPRMLEVTADTAATDPGLPAALRLRAPGLAPLDVEQPQGPALAVTVHGRGLEGVAAVREAGAWFGEVLGRDESLDPTMAASLVNKPPITNRQSPTNR